MDHECSGLAFVVAPVIMAVGAVSVVVPSGLVWIAHRVVGFGLRAPNVRVRGMDVAETVKSVGKNVTEFRAGDDVFGTCEGAFAGYACAPESNLALKPANLTLER